jgi:hypothetical protein
LVAHDFATKFSLIEIYSVFLKDYERTVFVYFPKSWNGIIQNAQGENKSIFVLACLT